MQFGDNQIDEFKDDYIINIDKIPDSTIHVINIYDDNINNNLILANECIDDAFCAYNNANDKKITFMNAHSLSEKSDYDAIYTVAVTTSICVIALTSGVFTIAAASVIAVCSTTVVASILVTTASSIAAISTAAISYMYVNNAIADAEYAIIAYNNYTTSRNDYDDARDKAYVSIDICC
jgi:hypothetical protein